MIRAKHNPDRHAPWIGVVGLVFTVLLNGCGWFAEHSPRAALEASWQRANHCLVLVPFSVPEGAAARTLRFDRRTLRTHRLYLQSRSNDEDYVYVDAGGGIQREGRVIGQVEEYGELFLAGEHVTLFADGRRITMPGTEWQIFWESTEESAPQLTSGLHPRVAVADGFMRYDLGAPPCEQVIGDMALSQHGGGMARDEAEVHSYDFQRAVNPFTVRGSGGGELLYGQPSWAEYLGEARFYLGVPRTGHITDGNTVPTNTDMLVVQGSKTGRQIGFGWVGSERRFCLVSRRSGQPWQVLARDEGPRPPLTDWVRVGIAIRNGCQVEGWLDRRRVLTKTLGQFIGGPFRVVVGMDPVELDDVRIRSLPLPPEPAQPLLVTSRAFAGKQHKNKADPQQFGEWAEGQGTFVHFVEHGDDLAVGIRTRRPLIGPWEYRSQAYDERFGELPVGSYRFVITAADIERPLPGNGTVLASFQATRDKAGWTVELPNWQQDAPLFPLRFRRTADGDLQILRAGRWVSTGLKASGSVRLGIARRRSPDGILVAPRAEHHSIYCRNLRNEFFEETPADWSWVDGSFRMDARWACQNQWNFLACGSTEVPMMVSKRRFDGAQVHEYFVSQRPVMPWDAGDTTFSYDPDADRQNKFHILISNEGWYVRHDLNLSFCCDGRNPLSGYAVLFAADDNQETRLVRRGKVVARTSDPSLLFPKGGGFGVVHYFWRRISVWKQGGRIRVWIGNQSAFDYTDPEPIPGGHIAFWSVRNGFAVTKADSLAESVSWEPDVLYVPPEGPDTSGWVPLRRDALRARADGDGATRFTRTTGTGFGAVRFTFQSPLVLDEAPILELPITVAKNTALNLHVQTTAGSYLVQVNGPLGDTKALLTPDFEQGECFRLPTLSEADVRSRYLISESTYAKNLLHCDLRRGIARLHGTAADVRILSLTLGNSSNADYLLAGVGKNEAGAWFTVGRPRFQSEEAKP
jgi:hypothetical protein